MHATNGGDNGLPVNNETSIIYGIGSAGITPFESILFEKSAGDKAQIHVEAGQQADYFGHLLCNLSSYLPGEPPYDLTVMIQSVEPAKGHEVVKSMAQAIGCGSGCDCGCG